MKENLEELENILNKIFKSIRLRSDIEQIDLKNFDEIESMRFEDDLELQQKSLRFRETIVKYKKDSSFWNEDIPNLISLLENAKKRVQSYRKNLSEIGGKDLPTDDIVQLLKQRILTPETPISKTHKGQEYTGHLTTDGYLELEVSGIKMKLSLRKAALFAWETDPANQWTFWQAPDNSGEMKPLEYFRKLLKK